METKGLVRPIDPEIGPENDRKRCLRLRPSRAGRTLFAGVATLLFGSLLLAANAWSQTRQIERYTYDAAGNVIGIDVQTVDGPPQVDAISPDRIFAGTQREFVITGLNLAGASVATDWPGLSVTAAQAGDDRIDVTLAATSDAQAGVAALTVSTTAGSDNVDVLVRPAVPKLIANPLPLVVAAGGGQARLDLSLTEPAAADWVFDVVIGDTAIVTPAREQFQVAQGEVSIPDGLGVTGGNPGATRLLISSESQVLLDTSVIATPSVGLSSGQWQFFSMPLGVRKQRPIALLERGPVVGLLGVTRETVAAPVVHTGLVASPLLGVARGAVLTGVSPASVSRELGQAGLTLLGVGLAGVDAVEIVPDNGLLLSSLTPAADGRSVAVTLDIDPTTPTGMRRVVARAGGQIIRSASASADQFYLAGDLPRIDSIDPIVLNPGQTASLTVRGSHFSDTAQLQIEMPDGAAGQVAIDQPLTIAADRIQAQIHVAADASPGPRRVRVVTAAGTSSAELTPVNTLDIRLDNLVTYPLFDTRHLTVFKGEPPASEGPSVALTSGLLGIAKGPLATDIQPRLLETGRETRVTISGQGLSAVSELVITPADGLIVGPLSGTDDLLEVAVEVAPDAARGLRRLHLATPSGHMTLAQPQLGVVQVVSPQPVVEGVSPVYIQPGVAAQPITISGRNFQQALAVRVLPQTDLQLGALSVAADGSQIVLSISAAAAAGTGPRVIQVETPAGATPAEPGVGNLLYVGDPMARLINVLTTPLLGVQRQVPVGNGTGESHSVVGAVLGVNRSFVRVTTTDHPAWSDRLGVVRGPVLFGIAPAIVPRGFVGDLILSGAELNPQIGAAFESSDGIAITRPAVVETDAEGRQSVRFGIAVDVNAPAVAHRIRVEDLSAGSQVPFVAPRASQLQVAGEAPLIQSISPILALPKQVLSLRIRGLNFAQATEVRVTPNQAIAVGTGLSINADGTELTVNLDIGEFAQPGPRLVQVLGPAGASSDVADASNTLTLIEP